jgi:radical SAM superfamily enzyme YgiQ (UPF0313 family)
LAQEAYRRTGYEEISLCGLSVSDYPRIGELLESLIDIFKAKAVSLSLPSIKPKDITGNISSLIATIKKTGLTFAPEAGSQRLREMLGKDFEVDDFFKTMEEAYLAGYQHLKLYFMIGLPEEQKEDLDSILEFANRASALKKKTNKGAAQVNISINTFIPKPQTPFQWLGMSDIPSIAQKQDYLKKNNKNKKLKLNFHNHYMTVLEGILSRGDRRLSRVILQAFKKGARFDAWQEHFNFNIWQEAFRESGIDFNFYLSDKSKDALLPWDFLDIGISKESLLAEFNKAIANKEDKEYNKVQ